MLKVLKKKNKTQKEISDSSEKVFFLEELQISSDKGGAVVIKQLVLLKTRKNLLVGKHLLFLDPFYNAPEHIKLKYSFNRAQVKEFKDYTYKIQKALEVSKELLE